MLPRTKVRQRASVLRTVSAFFEESISPKSLVRTNSTRDDTAPTYINVRTGEPGGSEIEQPKIHKRDAGKSKFFSHLT